MITLHNFPFSIYQSGKTEMTEEKKVVVVTGGAQGIGKGIAQELLTAGRVVILADLDPEAGEETMAEYALLGTVRFIQTDVSDERAAQNCIDLCVKEFGRIDGLVNNAGIASPHSSPLESLSLEDWNRVISTNLTGCFLMAKHAIPHLRRARGSIVNIASTRALQSEPDTEPYSTSKGGLLSFTHALAISLGPEVRVNCISPGWIDVSGWKKSGVGKKAGLTEADHLQHPAGRVGRPGDIAEMAYFLLSDAASFITGQNFVVDGGMTRKMIYVE
jgi:NAD(P)-dependent dehydrogenase (short-subunit alcohol dehydrogenase family)